MISVAFNAEMVVCRFYPRGDCWRGENCSYKHILPTNNTNNGESILTERNEANGMARKENESNNKTPDEKLSTPTSQSNGAGLCPVDKPITPEEDKLKSDQAKEKTSPEKPQKDSKNSTHTVVSSSYAFGSVKSNPFSIPAAQISVRSPPVTESIWSASTGYSFKDTSSVLPTSFNFGSSSLPKTLSAAVFGQPKTTSTLPSVLGSEATAKSDTAAIKPVQSTPCSSGNISEMSTISSPLKPSPLPTSNYTPLAAAAENASARPKVVVSPNLENTDSSISSPGIAEEILAAERGGQWLLSCFGPFKDQPCISGLYDVSPEEVRWKMYQVSKLKFQRLCQATNAKREALKNPNHETATMLEKLQKGDNNPTNFGSKSNLVLSTSQLGSNPSGTNVFGSKTFENTSGSFGVGFNSTPDASPIFGSQPAAPSIFSGASKSTPPVFGGTQNIPTFESAAQSGTSVFGGTATTSQSMFGQSSSNLFPTTQTTPLFSSSSTPQSNASPLSSTAPGVATLLDGATIDSSKSADSASTSTGSSKSTLCDPATSSKNASSSEKKVVSTEAANSSITTSGSTEGNVPQSCAPASPAKCQQITTKFSTNPSGMTFGRMSIESTSRDAQQKPNWSLEFSVEGKLCDVSLNVQLDEAGNILTLQNRLDVHDERASMNVEPFHAKFTDVVDGNTSSVVHFNPFGANAGTGGGFGSSIRSMCYNLATNISQKVFDIFRSNSRPAPANDMSAIKAREDTEEHHERESLNQQQDKEDIEVAKIDPEENSKPDEDFKAREEEEAQEMENQRIRRQKELALKRVPKEPEVNNPNTCELQIKIGQRTIKRRFYMTNTMMDVYYWVFSQSDSPADFQISTSYPKRVLYPCIKIISLFQAGLSPREVLHIK